MNGQKSNSTQTDTYHHGDLRRSLIEAALAMAAEEQNWTFSLREVARRAGVSHNAPYSHFRDKVELLSAIAAAGFAMLRDRMLAAIEGVDAVDAAFVGSGVAYVKFGLEHPTLYRLMFSSALATSKEGRPASVIAAGDEARAVLYEVIRRCARARVFPSYFSGGEPLQIAALTAWSTVHGLTMLAIDDLTGAPKAFLDHAAGTVAQIVCAGFQESTVATRSTSRISKLPTKQTASAKAPGKNSAASRRQSGVS
jgi:AcrR family transcriptional regulator